MERNVLQMSLRFCKGGRPRTGNGNKARQNFDIIRAVRTKARNAVVLSQKFATLMWRRVGPDKSWHLEVIEKT